MAGITLVLTGCQTTIPHSDVEPPKISLRFVSPRPPAAASQRPTIEVFANPGDGELHLPAASDVLNNLVPGTPYQLQLIASDAGGVSELKLQVPTSLVDIRSVTSPPTFDRHEEGDQTVIVVHGDRLHPTSLMLIDITYTPKVWGQFFDIQGWAYDWGGDAGLRNSRHIRMRAGSPFR